MAFKLRKDIKKFSYYVWFLGAKESKGLRGKEYIVPVIQHLEEREKDVEPFKVTLQVSHKGIKIIQNIVSQNPKNLKPKNETIKHFIPHSSITCVYQYGDIIACILLLFNPVTKCPLHVHAYRCDSLETASLLKTQLQCLVEKPENQKKFAEIENRLQPTLKTLSKNVDSSIGSDTGNSTRESESSEERFAVENTRITTLYDSVAAELREKLRKKNSPILLPPRDYDTVHRTKGNLTGIELRRCMNTNIVGQNVVNKGRLESSGGSSGIGSDHPPSPDSPDSPECNFNVLENQSTSDEDWNGDPGDSTLYLMHQPHLSLPRPSSGEKSPDPIKYPKYVESKSVSQKYKEVVSSINNKKGIQKHTDNSVPEYIERKSKMPENEKSKIQVEKERERSEELTNNHNKYYSEKTDKYYKEDIRYGHYDKRERSFDKRQPEKEKLVERRSYNDRMKEYDDDVFDERLRHREDNQRYDDRPQRYYNGEDEFYEGNYRKSEPKSPSRKQFTPEKPKYFEELKLRSLPKLHHSDLYEQASSERKSVRSQQEFYDDSTGRSKKMLPQYRQRSPSLDEIKHPKDRFKDAKKKFLQMEQESLTDDRRSESPISPVTKHSNFPIRNHFQTAHDDPYDGQNSPPDPEPPITSNANVEKVHYRKYDRKDNGAQRFKTIEKSDPKRRSMYSLIEEEHRRSSHDIAKELKRRSYMERSYDDSGYDFSYREAPESARSKSSYEQDSRRHPMVPDSYVHGYGESKKSSYEQDNRRHPMVSDSYVHGYGEPKMRIDKNMKNHFSDILHRTTSSLSNNSRVGIASVNPY